MFLRTSRAAPGLAALGLALALAPAVRAADTLQGDALARAKNCLACHQVDKKRVGPAYADVAVRYAGQPDAATHLEASIRQGGRGRWGAIPMPAQPQVSEAEARDLARWILTLRR